MTNRYKKRCPTSLIVRKCKSKPQGAITLHLLECLLLKIQEITRAVKDVGKSNTCVLLLGMETGTITMEYIEIPQEMKLELPYNNPAIFPVYICSEEAKTPSQKRYCISMLIAALFTRTTIWKQPVCPLMDKQTKKIWYTVEP